MTSISGKNPMKAIFLSDVHLGTKQCKAKELLDFLATVKCDYLFLVGDIIDGWALRRKHYWPKSHTEVLRRILKLSERCKVIYLPGNHDEFVRPFLKEDMKLGNVEIVDSYVFENVYICHGDKFDLTMKIPRQVINFFAHLSDGGSLTDKMYKLLGTQKVITKWAKTKGYDSVLTGHTHSPKIVDGYMNCGDWCENCTYITYTEDNGWTLHKYLID
jgi:UDP-2,3-diacylglucosamine pyrophosphatase LpxH